MILAVKPEFTKQKCGDTKTDLQKFKDLYDSIGVKYNIIKNEIYLYQRNDKKIVGDGSFFSVVEFNEDGGFISQGFFEQ